MDGSKSEGTASVESGTTEEPEDFMRTFGRVTAALQRNRPNFPLDELDRYRDHYIAWNPEVTTIIASTKNEEGIEDLIRAAGFDPAFCMVEFIS